MVKLKQLVNEKTKLKQNSNKKSQIDLYNMKMREICWFTNFAETCT